jgi:hypothetical protein
MNEKWEQARNDALASLRAEVAKIESGKLALINKAIDRLTSFYAPMTVYGDWDIARLQWCLIFAGFGDDIIQRVTGGTTGIQGRLDTPPTLADIDAACKEAAQLKERLHHERVRWAMMQRALPVEARLVLIMLAHHADAAGDGRIKITELMKAANEHELTTIGRVVELARERLIVFSFRAGKAEYVRDEEIDYGLCIDDMGPESPDDK